VTNQWSYARRLKAARAYHTATELANGDVVIAGGESGNRNINAAEIYRFATGKWERGGITLPISHHAAALLPDGQVLAIGGLGRRLVASPKSETGPPTSQ
jgi:N-acetylneuraminic acid mutarotase